MGWNPWHGCFRVSEGCQNCFIYAIDSAHHRDTREVFLTKDFEKPLKRRRNGEYQIPDGALVYTCLSSDFLLPQADAWRARAFEMMRARKGIRFVFFTKRIERLEAVLPQDWGSGYDNVIVGVSVENHRRADERLPILLGAPLKHRWVIAAPLLESLRLERYLESVECLSVGGESGYEARVCRYEWVLSLKEQANRVGVRFHFHQTGSHFVKDGRFYRIPKKLQRSQAKKAGLNG